MIVEAKTKLFIPCPNIKCDNDMQAGQLNVGQPSRWSCERCHKYFSIYRVDWVNFILDEIEGPEGKETPVTVTLRSKTVPPITLILNAWKYGHSQKDTPDDYRENQRYFYDSHTCPTNFMDLVEKIIFKDDDDPHGVFEFVSVKDGHYEDPYN